MQVLRINALDTINIRREMLRQDFPAEACHYPGDDDDLTFHLGGFVDSKLVSIASFYFLKHDSIEEENQFQLRGMATLPDHQGQGISSQLLKTAFPIIKQNLVNVLWCNARKTAIGYYESVGFEKVGDEFEVDKIGTHILMYKKI
jgi:predicted GNAT family N-acyltransferase